MAGLRPIEYRLLGPVEVVLDGTPRAVRGHRRQLLLAALLLAGGRAVRTAELIELLWEDTSPRHPESALRSQVARVRHDIGPDPPGLTFGAGGYALDTSGSVDVAQFERLAEFAHQADDDAALRAAGEALSLWRTDEMAFAHHGILRHAGMRLVELRLELPNGAPSSCSATGAPRRRSPASTRCS